MKFLSISHQPCQYRPTIVDINSNKTLYYLFSVSVSKCSGSCNTIDDPYAQIFVPNKV